MSVTYVGGRSVPRADLTAAFMEHMVDRGRYIATQLLPIVPVGEISAKFPKLKRSSLLRPENVNRSSTGSYQRSGVEVIDDSYSCVERGHEGTVDDLKRATFTDWDLETAVAMHVAEKILIDQEIDVAEKVQGDTFWPSTNPALYTDVSASPWDTPSSDVIGHIRAAKEKVRKLTGMQADTLVVSEAQFQNILANDDVLLRFPGATLVTEEMLLANLGAIFGLSRILRGRAVKNTAAEGATEDLSDIWNDDYALVCVTAPEGSDILTPCVGRTFLFVEDSPDIVTIDQYREENVRGGVFRARHVADEKIIDPAFGHRLKID